MYQELEPTSHKLGFGYPEFVEVIRLDELRAKIGEFSRKEPKISKDKINKFIQSEIDQIFPFEGASYPGMNEKERQLLINFPQIALHRLVPVAKEILLIVPTGKIARAFASSS